MRTATQAVKEEVLASIKNALQKMKLRHYRDVAEILEQMEHASTSEDKVRPDGRRDEIRPLDAERHPSS